MVRQLKLTVFVVRVEPLSHIADCLSDPDRFLNITFQELLAWCRHLRQREVVLDMLLK